MEWRPINGHPHYEVSSCGQVRSLDRTVVNTKGSRAGIEQRLKGRMLKPWLHKRGYHVVSLGHGNKITVHRLVAEAFLGLTRADKSTVVDHMDGDPTNNHVDNLRLGDRGYNNHHGGPAYRVLCELVGQAEADRLIEAHLRCEE